MTRNTNNNYKTKKKFGQHFLNSFAVLDSVSKAADISNEDILLEIGPGLGVLTDYIIDNAKVLHCVEIDKDLIKILQDKYSDKKNLKIHESDILNFDINNVINTSANKIKIIGNLPYNISTPILFWCVKNYELINSMVFMMQYEVVNRIVAKPNSKAYGKLGVILNFWFSPEFVCEVPPESFDPPPKVNSAVVKLIPKEVSLGDKKLFNIFDNVVSKAFEQRRKTISNSLKNIISKEDLLKININPQLRAENLSLDEFKSIAKFLTIIT